MNRRISVKLNNCIQLMKNVFINFDYKMFITIATTLTTK